MYIDKEILIIQSIESIMQEGNTLKDKYMNDPSFQAEMDSQFEKYQLLIQQAYYSNTSQINQDLLLRLDRNNDVIYFYCAMYHQIKKEKLQKTALYFYRNFTQTPNKNYSIVFLNHQAKSDAYSQFKEMLLQLSLDHFVHLQKFVIVRPTFFQKAADFIAFNHLPSYLKTHTFHLNSGKQLCEFLNLKEQDLVDLLPSEISQQQFPNKKPRKLQPVHQRINYQGQMRNQSQLKSRNQFQSTVKDFLFMKPGKQIYVITDYECGKLGIPVVLEVLIFYFKNHPQGLQKQGLFRKSVSIDQQNETLMELANQNYDCLLNITNAHLVANLIKRFFSNLRIPVFPFDQFQLLMHDQGVKDKKQHVKNVVRSLPKPNYRALMYLIEFLKQDVIANQNKNKMSAQNISICFAPCLLRAEKASHADLIYASKCAMVTKIMLEDIQYIFGNPKQRQTVFRNSEQDKLDTFKEELSSSIETERKIRLSKSKSPEVEEKKVWKQQKQKGKKKYLQRVSEMPNDDSKQLYGRNSQMPQKSKKPSPNNCLPLFKNKSKSKSKSRDLKEKGKKQE